MLYYDQVLFSPFNFLCFYEQEITKDSVRFWTLYLQKIVSLTNHYYYKIRQDLVKVIVVTMYKLKLRIFTVQISTENILLVFKLHIHIHVCVWSFARSWLELTSFVFIDKMQLFNCTLVCTYITCVNVMYDVRIFKHLLLLLYYKFFENEICFPSS